MEHALDRIKDDLKSCEQWCEEFEEPKTEAEKTQPIEGINMRYPREPSLGTGHGRWNYRTSHYSKSDSLPFDQNAQKNWVWMASRSSGPENHACGSDPQLPRTPQKPPGSGSEFPDGSGHRLSPSPGLSSREPREPQCMSRRHLDLLPRWKKREIRRHRRKIPRLRIEQDTEAAMQMDKFDQWLNQVQSVIATWSDDAEKYWSNAMKVAKEA